MLYTPRATRELKTFGFPSSTLDAVYVYVGTRSEFPVVPSYPHMCSAMVGFPHRPLLPSLPTTQAERVRLLESGYDCEVHAQTKDWHLIAEQPAPAPHRALHVQKDVLFLKCFWMCCPTHCASCCAPCRPLSDHGVDLAYEGRCKATWKREFKLPWSEAGPPNHHDDSGFGPVGCQ